MKLCPFCAESIQDGAIKCRFCGSMIDGSGATERLSPVHPGGAGATEAFPAMPTTGAAAAPSTLFAGAPSWRAQVWSLTAAVTLALAGLIGIFVMRLSFDLEWNSALVAGGVTAALGLLWLAVLVVQRRTVHYTITTRTIDVESGLLSKSIETLQLWKVRDIEFHQTLTDRIFGVASIQVFTQDVSSPQFLLWGLPASRTLFTQLKDAMELARQGRNIIGVVD